MRPTLTLSAVLVYILCPPRAASLYSTVLYVNRDNSCPGAGTSASPYCTIQSAVNTAKPGFDIRIRRSSSAYTESVSASTPGTANHRIVLEADNPSNPPVLTGQVTLNAAGYWTVQSLVFDGTGVSVPSPALDVRGGSWTASSDVMGDQVLKNTFRNWGTGNTRGDRYFQFVGVRIEGGWAPPLGSKTISGTVVKANTFDGIRGLGMEITAVKHTIIENNEFKNLACSTQNDGGGRTAVITDGVHEISGTYDWVSNTLYKHNTFHDYQPPRACPFTQSSGSYTEMAAVHCDVGPNNGILDSNVIWNLDSGNAGNEAIAFFVEDGCHSWTVKNNLVHDVGRTAGRNQPNKPGTVNKWFNNTFYNLGVHGLEIMTGDAVVENNVINNGGTSQIYVNDLMLGRVTIDYNDYWDLYGGQRVGSRDSWRTLNFSSWKSACGCDGHSLNLAPQIVSPSTSNYRLRSTSPLIDKGVTLPGVPLDADGIARPQLMAYDIGAYEYH
jgi:hypothetical protein